MRLLDILVLAQAKRRSHRIRTAVVVVASALLFAALYFITFLYAGMEETAHRFGSIGFNDHYFVAVSSAGSATSSDDTKEAEKVLIAEGAKKGKTAAQVKEDPRFDSEMTYRQNNDLRAVGLKNVDITKRTISAQSGVVTLYQKTMVVSGGLTTWSSGDQQDYATQQAVASANTADTFQRLAPEVSHRYDTPTVNALDIAFLREVVAKGGSIEYREGSPIPAIISVPMAEKIVGLRLKSAEGALRVTKGRELIEKIVGYDLRYCYRSSAALDQLRAVAQYNKTAAEDKDSTTVPIPIAGCTDFDQAALRKAGIVNPKANEADATKSIFELRSGKRIVHETTFRVAGVMAAIDPSGFETLSFASLLASGLMDYSYQSNEILIPREAARDAQLVSDAGSEYVRPGDTVSFIADLQRESDVRKLVAAGCSTTVCDTGNDVYYAIPFGNLGVVLGYVREYASVAAMWVLAIVASLSIAIVMLNVGKVVGDSRREIAIFRAIGARRFDIIQVYVVYGVWLGADAAIGAVMIAAPLAFYVHLQNAALYTTEIITALGVYDAETKATLFVASPVYLAGVTGGMLLAAFFGALLPSVFAVRKHMLKQLREE